MSAFFAWQMVSDDSRANGYRFERVEGPLPEPGEGEALVEVAGCGVCGTDLGYFFGEVPTVASPPLTLGHEVSGRVVQGRSLEGRAVVVPTIVPCRKCDLCRSGRANRCVRQKMFGGNFGTRGGFASHIVVPEAELTPIPDDCPIGVERMAVIADAVSTPYQAARRAGIEAGDKVIVIGATGGLGIYLAQWAKCMGAELVLGMARDEAKLSALEAYGLDAGIAVGGRCVADVRHEVFNVCRARRVNPRWKWKIFEVSGTVAGQEVGLELLTFASKLILVGYAAGTVTHTLSHVMAYDAEIVGSWGCDPRHYGEVVSRVVCGDIQIVPFTETRPMSRISETFEGLKTGRSGLKRVILEPDRDGRGADPGNEGVRDAPREAEADPRPHGRSRSQ